MKLISKVLSVSMLAFILCLCACGASRNTVSEESNSASTYNTGMAKDSGAAAESEQSTMGGEASGITDGRKLVKTVAVTAETSDFDGADQALKQKAAENGGYIEYASLSKYNNSRTDSLTIRIPSDKLEDYLSYLEGIMTIRSKSEQASDITEAYDAVDSEITSLETEQEALNGLLGSVKTVDEAISLQDRLSEIRTRLQELTLQKSRYDSQISYSSVSITLEEVNVAHGNPESIGERISYGFTSCAKAVGSFFVDLFVIVISVLPAIAVIAVAAAVILLIIKKKKTHRRKDINKDEHDKDNGPPSYLDDNH